MGTENTLAELGFQHYDYPDKFGTLLGYEFKGIDRNKHIAKTSLLIREDHLSPAKFVHGGVISAFFDYSCGAAAFSTLKKEDRCSTIDLKVTYFRPIQLGNQLEATSRVVFRGRRLCTVESFLYRDGNAEPVAMATATFNIVTSHPSATQK